MNENTNKGSDDMDIDIDIENKQKMILNDAAKVALNVFNSKHENMSLYKLLNKCKTSMGSNLLKDMLKEPITDHIELERRYDLVDFFINQFQLRCTLRDEHFNLYPKLDLLIKKLQKKSY